jgi:hypothetical protein
MNIWLTAILPVVAALLGVLIANRASSQRDATARVWERRADTYVDLFDWAAMVERETAEDGVVPRELPAAKYGQLAMPNELLTRMWIFASDPVRYAQGPCRNFLHILSKTADDAAEDPSELADELLVCLSELQTAIRKELSEGKLRIPFTFRIRQRLFPVKRRINMWRNRRRARKRHAE